VKLSIGRLAIAGTAVLALALALGACAADDDDDAASDTTSASTAAAETPTTEAVDRPDGPVADVSEELTGGDGVFMPTAVDNALDPGYVEEEYVAAGTATSYTAEGELTGDGMWTFAPGPTADYRTRVIVRRPKRADDFNGMVVVEWLNVSGGVDADPEYVTLREELVRSGAAYVGVSAQSIGVEGGPVAVKVDVAGSEAAGMGMKAIDPARYGSLSHPGDAFSFDIFTQVARAIRAGDLLGDLEPQHVVAAGESQSAFAMVTYVNGVQPLTEMFDGFFVHSRGRSGLTNATPGQSADIASSIGGPTTIFRTDTDVPIFDIQTESDVVGALGSIDARQDDSDTFRLWEVPGTAHADVHLVGPRASEIECGVPINDGPLHIVAKAAYRHFVAWVVDGTAPPTQSLLETPNGAIARDEDGIALGGVRTPPVDVPTRALSGAAGPNPSVICLLLGSTNPMTADRLAALYSSQADFQEKYDAAVDAAIDAGVVLEEDRGALEGYAHPELVSS
jgi:hypothetical protein